MLAAGSAPKTVRNVLSFLHSVFEHAIARWWVRENPVRRAARPKRKRASDANPDLQFLTVAALDAVLRAIPDEVVRREPKLTRRGRRGPAPPPPPDVLGPVLRLVILAAAVSGLRQSELLGLRWRDVGWRPQRIRVRNTFVRGEHSGDGKSDLSTTRSVPMATELAVALDQWSRRTAFSADEDLVFAHPQTGRPLDRTKVTRRFQRACRDAGVRVIRFHDLRHTFGTHLVGNGLRCGASRSGLATRTRRRRRSTRTTRRASTRSRRSMLPSRVAATNGRTALAAATWAADWPRPGARAYLVTLAGAAGASAARFGNPDPRWWRRRGGRRLRAFAHGTQSRASPRASSTISATSATPAMRNARVKRSIVGWFLDRKLWVQYATRRSSSPSSSRSS